MGIKLISEIATLALLISLVCSVQSIQTVNAGSTYFSTPDFTNITSEIVLTKNNYSIGETVNWTYLVNNSGGSWVNVTWGSWPYYAFGYDTSESSNFWNWPVMEPPDVGLWVIVNLDIPPFGNESINPFKGWHLENVSSGYYRVWLAFMGYPELSAWAYFTVGKPSSDVSADFSKSISYDPSTGNYTLTVNASVSKNLFDGNSALEFRWDWESDGTWDTNWSQSPQDSHVFNVTGNHSIGLEARDVFGNSDAISKIVAIEAITLDDIVTTIRTDKSVYEKGENMTITISIFNPTNALINLYAGSYPPFYFTIQDESGHTVGGQGWRSAMNTYDTIGPNETISFVKTYEMQLDPGFYLMNGSAYDAPHDQTWFRINGTGETLPSGYDSAIVVAVFLAGIGCGTVAALFYFKRKTK